QHGQLRSAEDERPAMGDAGLDDEIGPGGPDDLLYRLNILRVLDDWPSHPVEIVDIPFRHRYGAPLVRERAEIFIPGIGRYLLVPLKSELLLRIHRTSCSIFRRRARVKVKVKG